MEGYDAKFEPPLEKRLECPICLLAQREPMQTPCGHRFCSACILRALRETGPRCPVDKTKLSPHLLFKDNFAKREVLSLNVHCLANDHGCYWQGELRDLELHSKHCDLVSVDCPNLCGYNCQRKELFPHLKDCPNKPCQCPTCSINFPRNKVEVHTPFCSKVMLTGSVQDSLFKANEVLKWVGHLKLKLNGQPVQVTGYLSVKAESEESFMFTGTWCSTLSVIPLNSGASKIFWKMLHGPEVQPVFFNFAVLNSGDPMSATFQKMLRRRVDNLHAAVGLRLRPMNRHDLTLIYFYWSEQKKRMVACVAEMKSHLVRVIQNRLQLLQQSRSRRRTVERTPGRPTNPLPGRLRIPAAHFHRHPHPYHHHGPPPHFPTHPHQPPPPHMRVIPNPAHPQPPSGRNGGPTILPSLLSWQMSQSLNTFPWRVQANGVPFFTFPSTPPQFIPTHSYPYTFAPLPAAPFPIQPVNVPTGIAVPQVAADQAIPLTSATTHAPSFAVPAAALQSLAAETYIPPVAVRLSGVATPMDPVTVPIGVTISESGPLIQQQFHHADYHHPPPALIPAELASPPLENPSMVTITRQSHDSTPARLPRLPHDNEQGAFIVHLVPPDNNSSSLSQSSGDRFAHNNLFSSPTVSDVLAWNSPGPSNPGGGPINLASPSDSEISGADSSPATHFPTFSALNSDSDTPSSPDLLDSPFFAVNFSNASSSESSSAASSDSEGGSNQSDSESSPTNSALHTLANAAAILASSPHPNEVGPPPAEVMQLLDSDSESRVTSPPSVIDLTRSPLSPPPNRHSAGRHDSSHSRNTNGPPMLMPVIHNVESIRRRDENELNHAVTQPPTQHAPQHIPGPVSSNFHAMPVLGWPHEGVAAAVHHHHHHLHRTHHGYAPATIARLPGGFWDTVIPSLDMSLQNGSSESRAPRTM